MKKYAIGLMHFSYWSFYVAVLLIVFFAAQMSLLIPPKHIHYFLGIGVLFVLLPSTLGFYASYFLLFQTYLQRRNLLTLLRNGLTSILVIALFCGGIIAMTFDQGFMFNDGYRSFYSEVLLISTIALINGVIGFILKGFISWYKDLKIKEILQKTTHAMELELIKSKLDPHFLFNTINNIDGMMIKDTQVASNYLDKLSTILRFMLYESKAETISLTKELEYIQKYIDLQKIRTINDDFVNYTVSGHHNKHQIPAMLFIPFIENAFKHVESKKQYNAIEIDIDIASDKVHFHCQNYYNPRKTKEKETGGVGNALIAKRLQLLYPDRHQIKTTKTDDTYTVELTILTNEN